MPMNRRQALEALSALFAVPLLRWPHMPRDPLAGTILEFQAGRVRGEWTATEVTQLAIDRSYAWNRRLHSTDLLSPTALDDARASDRRARRGALLGPLDGVPLFAKSIYDMKGLPPPPRARHGRPSFRIPSSVMPSKWRGSVPQAP
jgi:hypothetical protein